VIANETVAGEALRAEIVRRAASGHSEVLVVCPALNSRLRRWFSDEDGARAAAKDRLESSLAALLEVDIAAQGQIGDGDPVQAAEDALRTFAADEIIVSTHPPGRSNWLEKNVVGRVRERFSLPITHVLGECAGSGAKVPDRDSRPGLGYEADALLRADADEHTAPASG
jgi:hypothetical protein